MNVSFETRKTERRLEFYKLHMKVFSHNIVGNVIVAELNNRIREDLRLLTSLSESLALLDMMVNSFANLISTKPAETYVRPEFTGNKIFRK